MGYDWLATLVFLGVLIVFTVIGKRLAFRIPALARMRELNETADRKKLERPRFREAVEVSKRSAGLTNLAFLVLVLPFCLDLTPRPLWRHAVDVLVVLMVYDFFYYWTHRTLFHGRWLRKVHALHHQAHQPTHIDALYVHPVENVIGLTLFFGTLPLVAAVAGAPLHAVSMAFATTVFTQWNVVNHTFVHLPRFPFRTLDTVTSLHAAHHVDMNRGNFATLTMLYDWLFGTLEAPVRRSQP